MTIKSAKFVSAIAGAALAFSAFVPTMSAATLADLQAQLAALMAQINSLSGGTSVSTGYTFTRDLTVGSSGADVTALQQALVAKGFLTIPAGTAYGYFGGLTRAAVARWQASAGVTPAAGYFGAKSRAAFAGMTTTTTTTTTTTGGTTTTSGGITTPGAEGILTVTSGPISNTVVNVGQKMVPVMTVRANAQNSDIAVQRITLDLGSNSNIYNKLYQTLYVMDQGRVLATVPLNSTTVVQSGSSNIVSLTGFSFVVPKGSYKDLTISADLYSSIDSVYVNGGATPINATITVPGNGVRGTDGAGIDQFGPTAPFSQTIIVNRSLVDNSIANISVDSTNPQANTVPVTDTTNGQYLKLPVLTFSVGAQNDAVHFRTLTVNFVTSGTGSVTAAYLYQGSTQVSSAAVSSGSAVFTNIQDGTAGASVPANSTLPYTIKVDVTGVTTGQLVVTASTSPTTSNLFNSQNGNVTTVNGSAAGNAQTVLGKGPAFTILGAPTISVNGSNVSGTSPATSTITATFNVQAQAIGTPVYFGTQASTTHPMFTFKVFNAAGTDVSSTVTATSSGFIVPTGNGFVTTGVGANSFYLPQQQTGTLNNIQFTFAGKTAAGVNLGTLSGGYSVEISSITYSNDNGTTYATQTYMDGLTTWRTGNASIN